MLVYMTIRTFVQGESRSQVYLDYAEPQPKVHLYERIIFIKNFFNFHLELRELCFQGIGKCVLTTFGFNHKQQCTIFFFST